MMKQVSKDYLLIGAGLLAIVLFWGLILGAIAYVVKDASDHSTEIGKSIGGFARSVHDGFQEKPE